MKPSSPSSTPDPSCEKKDALSDQPLRNFWYLALNGAQLKRGQVRGLTLVGDAVMVGRAASELYARPTQCQQAGAVRLAVHLLALIAAGFCSCGGTV